MGKTIKSNTNEFIEKSNKIHKDRYDYSLSEYVNNKIKIKIICKSHGEFLQMPRTHLEGSGCPTCGGKSKLTKEDFIKKASTIHNNKFDYRLVEYINNRTKIKIICPDHGIFEQVAFTHLSGTNCPKCSSNSNIEIQDFIKRSNIVHNNEYVYSLIDNIKSNKTKVKIICKKHGLFEQTINNHLRGHKCKTCVGKNIKSNNHKFKIDAFKIHGNKYDYSLVNYKSRNAKVKIICPDHGIFEQVPASHLRLGCGCSRCNSSKGEIRIIEVLKKLGIDYIHLYKIEKYEYDFYLPEFNTFIEYDGEQHYQPIEYFGGSKAFKKQLERDKIKSEYCLKNNIHLVRVPYFEFDKIENIIIYLTSSNGTSSVACSEVPSSESC